MNEEQQELQEEKITVLQVGAVGRWIAMGVPERVACEKEGIDPWHFDVACATSRDFDQIIHRAKAEFLHRSLTTLRESPGGHRGVQFVLETVYPELFARPSRKRRGSKNVSVTTSGSNNHHHGMVLTDEMHAMIGQTSTSNTGDNAAEELQTSTSNVQRLTSNPSGNSSGRTSPRPSPHSPGDTSSGPASQGPPSPQSGEGGRRGEGEAITRDVPIAGGNSGGWAVAIRNKFKEARDRLLGVQTDTVVAEPVAVSPAPALVAVPDAVAVQAECGEAETAAPTVAVAFAEAVEVAVPVVSSPKRTVSLAEYQKAQAQTDVADATLGRLPTRLKKGARTPAPEPEPDRHFPGWTPLHFAAFHNQLQDAYFLLIERADPRAVSGDKKTPIDLARGQGHADMVTLLEKRFEDLKKNIPGVPTPGW